MLKIFANVNRQDVTYSWSFGQVLPQVDGKLLRLEASGNELLRISGKKEIPVAAIDTSCIIWHGRNAGRILNLLREITDDR
jgi:hypothetical protein